MVFSTFGGVPAIRGQLLIKGGIYLRKYRVRIQYYSADNGR